MSIRTKLLLSYAAMLIIPLVLLLTTALLLVVVFRGDLRNVAHLYETEVEGFEKGDFQRLVHQTILRNPDLLQDRRYLDELSAEMKDQDTFLVVRLGGETAYASEGIRSRGDVVAALPAYRHNDYQNSAYAKPFGNELYSIYQYDLLSADRKPVSLFVLTRMDPLVHLARQSFPILFASSLVILILTHALLTYFMSKHIIRPLRELRRAAVEIKEGNLARSVQVQGKDEIGQLGMAFEEMRMKLQHSLEVQTQYEVNRKELVANISHDLKTPITAIRGYVDGILEGVADSPEKSEAYIRTIAAKAAQMDHMIDELFLYSKLDLNRLPFHFEPVPVQAFLADWAEELAFELEKQQVRLEQQLSLGDDVVASVDRDSFRRVLTNVIQNSLKYMDKPDKRIRLVASAGEGELLLTIADNGPGIDEEALPHIFDRFYRAEQSRNADTGGSGLGLAIAKQIMEGHGGDIRADSTVGEGTRITLILPIHQEGTTPN
ncbi:sensor histidine kinase [Cohnella nanjingensis]|uniref:histidine kinase n=1 Tax=Cohnella nanjingensis TaxID=1387779 RepID=A0A7X0RRV2_9BACL|nr:HAMP domain-containing sensor histidine kinase [Cohnella nanjingensis]MBB6671356.1 HAMP domain-containing histidine kinase [Cohnella nanjingensis]